MEAAINEAAGKSPQQLDVLWGVDEIAAAIGRSRNATYHLLANGHLPARKVGTFWVSSREKLQAFFQEVAA